MPLRTDVFALRTILTLSAVLLLVGCAAAPSDEGEQTAVESLPTGAPASPNDADRTFLGGMIPHHEGALEMAALVTARTERSELTAFAAAIIAAQEAEIERMRSLLGPQGAASSPAHGGMDSMGMEPMDPGQMMQLTELEGEAFEQMFLAMMIGHHQVAVSAAEQVLEEGEDGDVATLATEIRDGQAAEIEQMQQWQDQWFD